jgi:hypothetical protein
MLAVVGREDLLADGFAAVVKFPEQPVVQLGQQRVDVLGWRCDAHNPAQQHDVAQVRRHHLGDAGVLHLDGDRPAVEGDRAVHLPDRCGGNGLWIPAGECSFRQGAEFFFHHGRGQLRPHRRDAVVQAGEGTPDRRGQPVVDVAGHLAELHHDASHRAQGVGHVLGGPQGQVCAVRLALLARSRVAPRRTARIPEPAAREQPERPNRAAAPRPPAPAGQGGPCQGRHDQLPGLRDRRGQANHLLMFTTIRSPSPLPAWACPDPATWPGILDPLVY